jgi:hypothetical protein
VNHIQSVPGPSGPWRIAVIDRGDDPKLMLATITMAEDITPVQLTDGRYYHWASVLEFVTARVGQPVELTPMTSPAAWTVRAQRNRVPQ